MLKIEQREGLNQIYKYILVSEVLGQKFQPKVAVSTIRTVEKKGGLDEFLINTPNSKLPLKAKKLKKPSYLNPINLYLWVF